MLFNMPDSYCRIFKNIIVAVVIAESIEAAITHNNICHSTFLTSCCAASYVFLARSAASTQLLTDSSTRVVDCVITSTG